MIYLIDDSNLASLNATFLFDKEYADVIHLINNVSELNNSIEILHSADCIMIHRTFANSTIHQERMAELTNDGELIPFVVFSAGDSEHAVVNENNPRAILGIKKSVFYSRLSFFLDTYKESNCINLWLLAYGKDYQKKRIRSLALSVLRIIEGKEGLITVAELATIASCSDFKELITMSNPALDITYDELLEKLEDNPVTFSSFRNNINQIVSSFYQYGKNIYIWK